MPNISRKSAPRPLLVIMYLAVLIAVAPLANGAQDLTPSVNYFNFDYGSMAVNSTLDSIIAGRYEVLVADGSYGTAYVSKYNDLVAYDPNMEFYVYHNFNDPYYSSAGLPPVNEWVGARMAADGQDSTQMYWHSEDYTSTDFGHYEAYATSEFGSRLLTYNGTRALVNNTNLNFIHHFVDYAAEISGRHSGRNYNIAGLWFDNMSIPATVGVGTGTSGRHIHEAKLGGPSVQYGAWTISDWQQAFRDTVLIKYMAVLGDSLQNRLGLKVCINALAWAYGDKDSYAAGYQPEYFIGELVKPVHREFEFGLSPHDHNEQLLYPGPTNSATSIDPAVVAADYSPVTIYQGQVDCSQQGVENWFNPGHGYLEYSFRDYYYDCLAMYYLFRAKSTFISLANVPEYRLGVLNWLDGGASGGLCVHAGQTGDSCYWIDALGVRVGRDGWDDGWDNDVVDWYAASVDCPSCVITDGQGKDNDNQNWVVFRRRWSGDDGHDYMVLLRTPGQWQEQFAGSHSPAFALQDGPWEKMSHDGSWGSPITTETLENGRGGIYRAASGECSTPPGTPGLASPADGSAVGSLQPSLCVTNATPTPGCSQPQTYQFEIYSDVDLTNRVVGPVTSSQGSGQTCLTPSSPLSSGRYYWWRARAYNGTVYSAWSGPYLFSTPNTAPSTPAPVSPGDGSQVSTSQPTLTVSAASDPDGTSLAYHFQVALNSSFIDLENSGVTIDQPSWTVSSPLSNGTYYWRARCFDGIAYSGWCSTRSMTIAVGSNHPPSLSMMMTPADGDTTTVTSPTLSVENGSDPDSDPLTYSFQIYDGTGTSLMAQATNIPEGTTTTTWAVPLTLAVNANYRWRVRCFDGSAYSDWSAMVQFWVISADACDTPPGTPTLSSPAVGSGVGSNNPALCVGNSTPAPGCTELQTYVFEVYEDAGLTTQVGSSISAAEGPGTTCVTVNPALASGLWYWWRARSYNGSAYSNWAGPFQFHTPNTTPSTPAPSTPINGTTVDTRQPTLVASPATDGDGTALVHLFQVATSSGFTTVVASGASFTSQWTVTPSLNDGGTYYWRTRATDLIDTTQYSSSGWFHVDIASNDPPSSPTHYLPIDGETLIDTPIVVTVNNAVDPDGDPLLYDFYLYDDSGLTHQIDERINISEGSGQTSASFFSGDLPVNLRRYYWHVLVHDQDHWAPQSQSTWFRYFSFATGTEEEIPAIVSPVSGSTVSARTPTLIVANISEPGMHSYYFDLAHDSGFVSGVISSAAVEQGSEGFTQWTVEQSLATGTRYYWRARADAYEPSAVASFLVEARVYASPNPVSFDRGESLTFHLPYEPVDLLVQTVSGDPVIRVDGVSGDWEWDGLNDSGHRIAAGVYLWYVRGTDYQGKIIVKP
ncbi:MAG: hypothetical protein ABIE70_11820 [bacterium]